MAVGAITNVPVTPGQTDASDPGELRTRNGLKQSIVTVVGDSSYVTGGSPLTPAQLGFANAVQFGTVSLVGTTGANNGAFAAALVLTNGGATVKLKAFATSGVSPVGAVEAGAAANLSGLTWLIVAYGY